MVKDRMERIKQTTIEEQFEHLYNLLQKLDALEDDIELSRALNARDELVLSIASLLRSE